MEDVLGNLPEIPKVIIPHAEKVMAFCAKCMQRRLLLNGRCLHCGSYDVEVEKQ